MHVICWSSFICKYFKMFVCLQSAIFLYKSRVLFFSELSQHKKRHNTQLQQNTHTQSAKP